MWQIFTLTSNAFIEITYNFLTFERIVKMYRYYIEILKHILATPWLEHAINRLPVRRPTPLGHADFVLTKLEFKIDILH